MASEVVMYSSRLCPFCFRAKGLFESRKIRYQEILVDQKPEVRQEMMRKGGRHTVPQIWIGQYHVGGCDDLMALERAGQLDVLLAS